MCYCFVLSTVLLNLSHRSQVDFHASSSRGFGVLNFQVCHLVGFFTSFFNSFWCFCLFGPFADSFLSWNVQLNESFRKTVSVAKSMWFIYIYFLKCMWLLLLQFSCMKSTKQGFQICRKKKSILGTNWTPLMQLLKPHSFTIHIKVQICTAECILIKSLSSLGQSLPACSYGVKSFVRTHQLWQLWGQGRWHQMRSVVVRCLPQFPAALLVSCSSFACGTDHITQLSIMLWKTMQKILSCFFGSCGDNSKPVLSTGSEPVDNRPPTKEDKQESAGTSR